MEAEDPTYGIRSRKTEINRFRLYKGTVSNLHWFFGGRSNCLLCVFAFEGVCVSTAEA